MPSSPYAGKVTAYDSPIYIADAALYLMATAAGAGHRQPVRARREPVRRRRRPAQDAAAGSSASTGRTTRSRWPRSRSGDASSARRGRSSRTCSRPTRSTIKTILPEGGLDRLVGHLDGLVQGQEPELRLHVDRPHHLAEGQRGRGGVVRRGARRTRRRAPNRGREPLRRRSTPTTRRTSTQVCVLDDAGGRLPRRSGRRLHRLSPTGWTPGPRSRGELRRSAGLRPGDRLVRP